MHAGVARHDAACMTPDTNRRADRQRYESGVEKNEVKRGKKQKRNKKGREAGMRREKGKQDEREMCRYERRGKQKAEKGKDRKKQKQKK